MGKNETADDEERHCFDAPSFERVMDHHISSLSLELESILALSSRGHFFRQKLRRSTLIYFFAPRFLLNIIKRGRGSNDFPAWTIEEVPPYASAPLVDHFPLHLLHWGISCRVRAGKEDSSLEQPKRTHSKITFPRETTNTKKG